MNFFGQLLFFAITTWISAVLAPKPPQPKAAGLGDVQAPTAEEGRPIPVVFGTVLITGANVVWYGDLVATPIKKKGGKK